MKKSILTRLRTNLNIQWTITYYFIPPSSFERLVPILESAPLVKLAYDGNTFDGFQLSGEPLPLQFDFTESEGKGYQLNIKGLHGMIVMNAYKSVLFEGKLIQLEDQDCKRLSDLKKCWMLQERIKFQFHQEQIAFSWKKWHQG